MSVSIIIPVHNSMKYLDECINSVLCQCKNTDEIILVENGSSDGTAELCRRYLKEYSNIRYLELGAVGVSVARNEGVRLASCDWITFLDSDDMLLDGALSVLKSPSVKDADIVLAGYTREDKKCIVEKNISIIDQELLKCCVLQFARYGNQLAKDAPIDNINNWACWGKFYKRELLQNYNVFFPQGISHSEDTAFCFHAYCVAKKIVATQQKIYYYRDNPNSICSTFSPNLEKNNIRLIEQFEYYRENFAYTENYLPLFLSFYTRKVIEIYYNCMCDNRYLGNRRQKQFLLKEICEHPIIYEALKKTKYRRIIIGKKNSLKYAWCLWRLKHAHYEFLFL